MPSAEPMSEEEFRGLVKTGAITNFVFNVLINGVIAWLLLSGPERLAPFGGESYGPDLLITGFLLSAIVTAIVIATHRSKAAKGELGLPAVRGPSWLTPASAWSRWKTCGIAGLLGTVASGVLLGATALTVGSLSVPTYVVMKALYTGVLAAAIVGPATLLGLRLGAAAAEVG
ncbi:MAG: hypothetical protein VX246_00750 [Myxococcota bacterium]|nr:hypothetical protein [Myxococcota bacterium]